ncbi:MAG TPA: DUF4185 domain-containing protein [Pseudonocardiaceae bacterium]|nr:DUF4185 domain-containing protein [Pseudonocardiaceae bacterium]
MSRVYVSLIQSDYGRPGHGNFEAVIAQDGELWHWFRDNSVNDFGLWARGARVTGDSDRVAGPGCLIQSGYGTGPHGNFEVIVPLLQPTGTTELWHFYRDNSDPHLPWIRGSRVTGPHDNVTGPGCLIQSDFSAGGPGNFEVIVPLGLGGDSEELRHFFRDNSDARLPWIRTQFVTQSCGGSAGIIQSRFGAGGHGDFEVIAEEPRDAVVHYWHPNFRLAEWWIRTECFDMRTPHPLLPSRARKVAQLTGEFDREGWDGTGAPGFALNRTESRFGIIGTDLGASFTHRDRLYFLFGDTWRVGHGKPNDDLDSIAFCTDTRADDGLELTFLPKPPLVPGIPQGGFNVPLDGVSWNGGMYVFFSTDCRQAGRYALMGRSIVARSDNDGTDFTLLHEISRYKFINVSAQIVDAKEHGLPGVGPQLVVFGSGRYRSSDVYLAVKPASAISEPGGFLFYSGGRDQPQWSLTEEQAIPLFGEGCVGELSVRWQPPLKSWVGLYNADWPTDRASVGGIVMRRAKHPWGPWSEGEIIFAVGDGLGRFMHLPNADHTQEGFGLDRSGDLAGMYGPYQIPRYSQKTGNGVRIYFAMSTWNPYQVMLMTADLRR